LKYCDEMNWRLPTHWLGAAELPVRSYPPVNNAAGTSSVPKS
jgi:hypothetical protein